MGWLAFVVVAIGVRVIVHVLGADGESVGLLWKLEHKILTVYISVVVGSKMSGGELR